MDTAELSVRVRVWFGRFPIVDCLTSPYLAVGQTCSLGRRFIGLKVTMEPAVEVSLPSGGAR